MATLHAPTPTVEDLALWLKIPIDSEGCHADLAETLELVAGLPLTPEQLSALAVARNRLEVLKEAARAVDEAAAVLSGLLWTEEPDVC